MAAMAIALYLFIYLGFGPGEWGGGLRLSHSGDSLCIHFGFVRFTKPQHKQHRSVLSNNDNLSIIRINGFDTPNQSAVKNNSNHNNEF